MNRFTPRLQAYRLQRPATRIWLSVTLYLIIFAAIRSWLNSPINFDNAEQVLLSQNWQLGYGDQPPLYTYLTKAAFYCLGPSLTSLTALKICLLSCFFAGLLLLSRELKLRPDQTIIAVSSYALIPQFLWTSQTSLSHSVLATTIGVHLLLVLIRAHSNPSTLNYLLLGALTAAGLLSKYNFFLLITAILATSLTIKPFRKTVLNPKFILTLTLAGLLIFPHFWWSLTNAEQAFYGWRDYGVMGLPFWAWPLRGLLLSTVFLSPFWLAFLILSWPYRKALHLAKPSKLPSQALLQRLPLAMAVVVTLSILLVTKDSTIRVHWFHSLLFYLPISAVTLLPPIAVKRVNWFVGAALIAALAALITPILQAAIARLSPPSPRKQIIPSATEFAEAIKIIAPENPIIHLIVADNIKLAATARLAFPSIDVIRFEEYSDFSHQKSKSSQNKFKRMDKTLFLSDSPVGSESMKTLEQPCTRNTKVHPPDVWKKYAHTRSSKETIIFYYSWTSCPSSLFSSKSF